MVAVAKFGCGSVNGRCQDSCGSCSIWRAILVEVDVSTCPCAKGVHASALAGSESTKGAVAVATAAASVAAAVKKVGCAV